MLSAAATCMPCFMAEGAAVPWTRVAVGKRSACPSEMLPLAEVTSRTLVREPRVSPCAKVTPAQAPDAWLVPRGPGCSVLPVGAASVWLPAAG